MGLYDDRLADLSEQRRHAGARHGVRPRSGPPQSRLLPEGSRKSTSVQSLLFDRSAWTVSKAKAWAESHGYRYGKVDVTDQYIRIRQFDPKGSKVKRTIPFGRGIRAVVAREESMAQAKVAASRRRRRRTSKKRAPKRARRRRVSAVAAPKRRRRRRAKKVVARRRRRVRAVATPRRRRRRRVRAMEAPRRRRRRRTVRAWHGNPEGHRKAAKKGIRRRRARKSTRRRRRRARETVMEAPRRRRRRSRRRTREAPVVQSRRRRRYHRRHHRSLMEASRGGRGMAMAEVGIAVLTGGLGFILADGVDRLLATYSPTAATRPTNKFTSDGAGTLANTLNVAAKPSLIRIGAGIGMTALPAVGASMVRRPMARAAFEGMTVGAGVSLFKMIWNGFVVPMFAPKDTSTASLQKSIIVRLYPAEVAAHINAQQQQVSAASGVLSGAPADVGPFALGGSSEYPDAAQALRNATGVHDQFPTVQNTWGTGGPGSDWPTAAQVLNRGGLSAPAGHGTPGYPGVGEDWAPGPPAGPGAGPQAKPHTDPACGCVGDPTIGFSSFLGDAQEPDPLFNIGN